MATQATQKSLSVQSLSVVKGPSLFDLMLALFTGKQVVFDIKGPDYDYGIVYANIRSVSQKGASWYEWGIEGELYQKDYMKYPQYPHRFIGTYNSQTRKGSFKVEELVPGSITLLRFELHNFDEGREELQQLKEELGVPEDWPVSVT